MLTKPQLPPTLALPFFVTAPLPFWGFPFPLFGFKGVLRIYYFDKLRDNFYFVQFSIRKMTNLSKNLWSGGGKVGITTHWRVIDFTL